MFDNLITCMLMSMKNYNRSIMDGNQQTGYEDMAQYIASKALMDENGYTYEVETVPYFEEENGDATNFMFAKLTLPAEYRDSHPIVKTLGFKTNRNSVIYEFDLPTDKLCPFGGDIANDCAECAYACDYHYVCGECVRR